MERSISKLAGTLLACGTRTVQTVIEDRRAHYGETARKSVYKSILGECEINHVSGEVQ